MNLQNTSSRYIKYLKQIKTFFQIRNKYEVFHFNYGSSLLHAPSWKLLNQFDLPFYPKKAKLFVTYNGCDARQKYPTMLRTAIAPCHNTDCYGGMCNSGKLDEMRRRGIEKMKHYVDHIWALNPDLLHFLPSEKASFLPYTVCISESNPVLLKPEIKLKIVHAPTNQAAKGSLLILAALNKLKKKYPDLIEIILIENVSYEQAIEMYKVADLIIDQILAGWYGAFAVETMLMGKPVIARIAEEDLKFIPQYMAEDLLQTIINANPSTIYHVLERCIHNREFLRQRAQASLEYAKKWHNPQYVAGLTKEQYEK